MKAVLITSSILTVLIAVLRPLLRGRIDPRVQYALWLAVALRLLLPVNFADSAYSALALLERAGGTARIVEKVGQTTIPVPVLAPLSEKDALDLVMKEREQNGQNVTDLSVAETFDVWDQVQDLQETTTTLATLVKTMARPVWLGGAAVMAAWFLLVNLGLRRRLRDAEFVEADCPLPVYVLDALPSPCLYGVVRPAICVTPAVLEREERLRHVLAHELTHFRHKDHWWALVRCLCLCVYWFNPLVWWAAALSRQDCELACDEGAIRRLGEGERLPYGRTLVDMIAAGRTSLLQTATTMTGGKRRVRERIKLIARRPKTVIAVALALALIVGCAVGCTFTGAPEASVGPEESQKPVIVQPLGAALSKDSLQQRLLDIPEELLPSVEVTTSETKSGINDIALVVYWDRSYQSVDHKVDKLPWLLSVHRWERSLIDAQDWVNVFRDGVEAFLAQDNDFYYTIQRPVDSRFEIEGSERFTAAYKAIRDHVERQILTTEGVEQSNLPDAMGVIRDLNGVMDAIADAPGTSMTLYRPGAAEGLTYNIDTPPDEYRVSRLLSFPTNFDWKKLAQEEAAALMEQGSGVSLRIVPSGSASPACITVYEGSPLVEMRTVNNETAWYQVKSLRGDDPPLGTFILNPGPFEILRDWFDQAELSCLHVTTVPDRGQSHQDVVVEWLDGFEGAFTKCASGSQFACTYVKGLDVETDRPDWLSEEDLDNFARSHGFEGAYFKKTWFGFRYSLVFVPENENAKSYLMAGNTHDCELDGVPEGAMVYTRMGFMQLIDGHWVCEGTGTGW